MFRYFLSLGIVFYSITGFAKLSDKASNVSEKSTQNSVTASCRTNFNAFIEKKGKAWQKAKQPDRRELINKWIFSPEANACRNLAGELAVIDCGSYCQGQVSPAFCLGMCEQYMVFNEPTADKQTAEAAN